jgi:YVTN family beta-propeller protein
MRVFLAGRVAIEAGEVRIDEARFPGRQGRLVFAYLVLEQGRPVPHEELAEALWGEALPAAWKKALTVLVSKIRGLLAECGMDDEKALTSAFGCYRLDLPDDAWVDVIAAGKTVQEAEDALASGELERAKTAVIRAESLARPSFLPGDDGVWVDAKRRELANVLVRALACLADASSLAGDSVAAVKRAEEAVALEPFRESGYRRLMEIHAAAGNRAEALRVYERCRRLLADELGAFPSPETEAIYRDLLRTPAHAPPTVDKPAATNDASLPLAPRASRRRPRRLAVAGAGALVVAAAGALLLAGAVAFALVELTTGGTEPPTVAPNSVAVIDAKTSRVIGDMLVGSNPIAVAAGEGGIWVANADDGTVTHIDPKTRKVVKVIGIGGDVSDIAVGFGSVWVANGNEGTLVRIDPELDAIERAISLGGTELQPQPVFLVAVGGGAVWATSGNRVIRIDPQTNRPLGAVPAKGPTSVAYGEGAVWVSTLTERLLRIEPETGRIATVAALPGPTWSLVAGHGWLWGIVDLFRPEIWRFAPATGSAAGTVGAARPSVDLAVSDAALWATSEDGAVSRIDPEGLRVVAIVEVGQQPTAIAAGDGALWVCVTAPNRS